MRTAVFILYIFIGALALTAFMQYRKINKLENALQVLVQSIQGGSASQETKGNNGTQRKSNSVQAGDLIDALSNQMKSMDIKMEF